MGRNDHLVVEARAGGRTGIGYTYGAPATGALIHDELAEVVDGARRTRRHRRAGRRCVARAATSGRPGLASMAICAIDTALWDLKARLLELPLATLLDAVRDAVPVYGSGGFTSYSDRRLADQLGGWVADGSPGSR